MSRHTKLIASATILCALFACCASFAHAEESSPYLYGDLFPFEQLYTPDDVARLADAFDRVLYEIKNPEPAPPPTLSAFDEMIRDSFENVDPDELAARSARMKRFIEDGYRSSGVPQYNKWVTIDNLLDRYRFRMTVMGFNYPKRSFPDKDYGIPQVGLELDDWWATVDTDTKRVVNATWTQPEDVDGQSARLAAFLYSFTNDYHPDNRLSIANGQGFLDTFESDFRKTLTATWEKPYQFGYSSLGGYDIWTSSLDPLTIHATLHKNW